MADSPKNSCPPYATFAQFINFLNKLREGTIPGRIDPSVFGNASGSVSYSIIASLKVLHLIEQNGVPTAEFAALVKATDEDRKPLLRDAMRIAYPTLHGQQFPLENASAAQFDEHIRLRYEAKGSTVDKVASFFIAASDYAEIPISGLIKSRKPSTTPSNSGKAKRQKRADEKYGPPIEVKQPVPQENITDKALEYKLVDLMRESDIDAYQRDAIWVLLQYLTAKSNKDAADA